MTRIRIEDWAKSENLVRLQGWARDGLTDEQICKNIGVTVKTLYNWKKKNVQILQALKIGKETADRQVENALFKSAVGYHYKEEVISDRGEVVKVEKYSKPNTTSQIFWLKNRKPETWRDKRDIEHEGNVNQSINLSNISDKDLKALAKAKRNDN